MSKRILILDYPSKFSFPNFGLGSAENRIWFLARTLSESPDFEVTICGPLWLPEYVPRARDIRERFSTSTVAEIAKKRGHFDFLFAGHEYFDRNDLVAVFLAAADCLLSYQGNLYAYNGPRFDRRRRHLFCYSDEMLSRYADQHPYKLLCVHRGVDEEPRLEPKPEPYLVWMGRIDYDKAPHYAIEAARRVGLPIKILGAPLYQPEYANRYKELLNRSDVELCGVLTGTAKTKIISRALCGIYTCSSEWTEAAGAVFCEFLTHGIPIAGMTWKGNDSVCEAVNDPALGVVVQVEKDAAGGRDRISRELARAVSSCFALDRKVIYGSSRERFDPIRLAENMIKLAEFSYLHPDLTESKKMDILK